MSTIGIDIRNIGKNRTGDEVVFFNLVKNLAVIDGKNQYRLFTDTVDEAGLEKIGQNLEIISKNNFRVVSLASKNRFGWNFWTLPKHLRKNSTDIYLTQYITPWFVPEKVKIITVIHDISFRVFPEFIKKSDLFFLNWLIPKSLRRATKIIGVSNFTKSEVVKYYKIAPEKIDWIPNAVSEDFLKQDASAEKMEMVKDKYKLPGKFILYLGTFQPRKNLPALIDGYALLRSVQKFQDIKLVLAGGKGHNYDKSMDELIKKYKLEKDVIFPGYIEEEDKAALIKSAVIFCFPSLYEGFGIPILEAMSVGTPVVASDIPSHREISGDAALFFNPRVAGEVTQKMSEIINNPVLRGSLVFEGIKQAKKFSWRETAEKMLKTFNEIIDKERE